MAQSHRARAAAIQLKKSLLAVAIASSLSCASSSLEQREWWVVETTRFEITSSLPPQASLELARDLERFVIASEAILGTSLKLPNRRTRVYAHDGKGFERPFDLSNQPSYFLPSPDGGSLVLRTGSAFEDATESARFALLRYLADNNGSAATPLWYDEGFASFLSTARPEGRAVVVGEPRRDLLALLRDQVWPPSDQLLATTSLSDAGRRERANFRARTWALVHFLHFGTSLEGATRARLDAALADRTSRKPGGGTTLDWFDVPAKSFDRDLRRYVGSELGSLQLVVRIDEIERIDGPHPLDCAGVGEALGRLAVALERDAIAKKYFRFAATCAKKSTLPKPHAGGVGDARGLHPSGSPSVASEP
jgi:hypothetical protein